MTLEPQPHGAVRGKDHCQTLRGRLLLQDFNDGRIEQLEPAGIDGPRHAIQFTRGRPGGKESRLRRRVFG